MDVNCGLKQKKIMCSNADFEIFRGSGEYTVSDSAVACQQDPPLL